MKDTEGLNEKIYNKIISNVLINIPDLKEWHSNEILQKFDNLSWKKSIIKLHDPNNIHKKGNFFKRLVYDEIFATLLSADKDLKFRILERFFNRSLANSKSFNETVKVIFAKIPS